MEDRRVGWLLYWTLPLLSSAVFVVATFGSAFFESRVQWMSGAKTSEHFRENFRLWKLAAWSQALVLDALVLLIKGCSGVVPRPAYLPYAQCVLQALRLLFACAELALVLDILPHLPGEGELTLDPGLGLYGAEISFPGLPLISEERLRHAGGAVAAALANAWISRVHHTAGVAAAFSSRPCRFARGAMMVLSLWYPIYDLGRQCAGSRLARLSGEYFPLYAMLVATFELLRERRLAKEDKIIAERALRGGRAAPLPRVVTEWRAPIRPRFDRWLDVHQTLLLLLANVRMAWQLQNPGTCWVRSSSPGPQPVLDPYSNEHHDEFHLPPMPLWSFLVPYGLDIGVAIAIFVSTERRAALQERPMHWAAGGFFQIGTTAQGSHSLASPQTTPEVTPEPEFRPGPSVQHRMNLRKSLGAIAELGLSFVGGNRRRTFHNASVVKADGMALHRMVPPHMWCVTAADLKRFKQDVWDAWCAGRIPDNDDEDFKNPYHNDPDIGPNIYQVNKHFIMPETKRAGGMSYALMLHPEGLVCDVFVTHAWAEGIFEFISKVLRGWPRSGKHLWCCFLANPQNGNIASLLGSDVRTSPFAQALRVAQFVIVVPNKTTSIYKRLWCVYEAKLAVERDLDMSLPAEVSHYFLALHVTMGMLTAGVFGAYAAVLRVWHHQREPVCDVCKFRNVTWAPAAADQMDEWLQTAGISDIGAIWLLAGVLVVMILLRYAHPVCKSLIRLPKVATMCLEMAVLGLIGGRLVGDGVGHPTWPLDVRIIRWFLPVCLILTGANWVFRGVWSEMLSAEAAELDFTSVRDAECFSADDRKKIQEAIRGDEERIDNMIRILQHAGMFNRLVRKDVEYGLDPIRGRAFNWAKFASTCLLCALILIDVDYHAQDRRTHATFFGFVAVLLPAALVVIARGRGGLSARRAVMALEILWHGFVFLWLVIQFLDLFRPIDEEDVQVFLNRMYDLFLAWCVVLSVLVATERTRHMAHDVLTSLRLVSRLRLPGLPVKNKDGRIPASCGSFGFEGSGSDLEAVRRAVLDVPPRSGLPPRHGAVESTPGPSVPLPQSSAGSRMARANTMPIPSQELELSMMWPA